MTGPSIRSSAHPPIRPFIEVSGLTREYAAERAWLERRVTFRAVNDVSLTIGRGETLGLVGESGSGKTTLGRCIIRLIEPTEGTIHMDGTDVRALESATLRQFRRRMQIVFQDATGALNPRMRVGQAVKEPIEVHRLARGADADARVATLFQEVGLDPSYRDRYPHELSGGQRQRVVIARALSVEPEFIVLDEPVSALDVSVQAQVLNLLGDLKRKRGLTYLFIAHDLAVVRHIADHVAVMYLGRIVETAPAATLYGDPRHPYTRALLSAVPVADPKPGRARIVLAGDPPSPLKPPPGCPFHQRCFHPKKNSRCATERPELRVLDGAHRVACHFADEWP
ncbi:MAG: ATP-binding cassette domain-containing protein [Gemmatimonadetes bacterium]|nr:ATP-binding cassette domain-containing protein [Gemmatimonadota bacterium]